jgi:hypothetical protein
MRGTGKPATLQYSSSGSPSLCGSFLLRYNETLHLKQGCESGLDPDSLGSVDPDPDSGSGSRRAKMTHKSRKKFVKVHVLKCWMASFES